MNCQTLELDAFPGKISSTHGLWGENLNHLIPPGCPIGTGAECRYPVVSAYCLDFYVGEDSVHRIYVHAGERYEFYLDGLRIGRGNERGDDRNAFCESYDLVLQPGNHRLLFRVWSLGKDLAPFAQMSTGNFLTIFSSDPGSMELLATGIAPWQTMTFEGYSFDTVHPSRQMTGVNFHIDGRLYPWDWMHGGCNWRYACHLELPVSPALYPASLPRQDFHPLPCGKVCHVDDVVEDGAAIILSSGLKHEICQWQRFINGESAMEIPPHSRRRVIIDLEEYRCFYPELRISGGRDARVVLSRAEALYLENDWNSSKGNRSHIDGKFFCGPCDSFIADGSEMPRAFAPLWWRSGRYLELRIDTLSDPLTLHSLYLENTGMHMPVEAEFYSSDLELDSLLPILTHSLKMCSHETYMDCPFYEQLMYVGDTRIEMLVNYVMNRDHRLARKSLIMFFDSISDCGGELTRSRFPSSVRQVIPPFSLWWIAMLHDYAMWHDDPGLVRKLLPGVRRILDTFSRTAMPGSHLVLGPAGWNFYDWADDKNWRHGVPPTQRDWTWGDLPSGIVLAAVPGNDDVPGSIMNFHYVMTLMFSAELEQEFGDTHLAESYRNLAKTVAAELTVKFYQPRLKLFADDPGSVYYSEHAQILAVLSGVLDSVTRKELTHVLLIHPGLTRATIYFSHYLFELIGRHSNYSELRKRLELWLGLRENGLCTTPESPEPSRSDCHAWGAHPYYHCFSTIAGIRPSAFGGRNFNISPMADLPEQCSGVLPLLHGDLHFSFRRSDSRLKAEIILPDGICAKLSWNGETIQLKTGCNRVEM